MSAGEGYGSLVLMEKPVPGLARITLNRPEKRNALNSALAAELRAAARDSWDCYVVVITGNGPAFSAEADVSESRERKAQNLPDPRVYANSPDTWPATIQCIVDHPAVWIAQVNGYCLGAAMSLVNACNLALASDKAQFGLPEMEIGIVPGSVAGFAAKRMMSKSVNWLVFTAMRIDAHTAERWCIINAVVPHDSLAQETDTLARRILGMNPTAIDYAKKALSTFPQLPWELAGHYGQLIGTQARQSGA